MSRKTLIIITVIAAALILPRINNQNILSLSQFINSKDLNIPDDNTMQPIEGRPQVQIETSKGDVVIELRPDVAPKTVARFLGLFAQGKCDNLTFHRVEDWVVQGCDPKGDGTGGELSLPTEISSESFTKGAVGVARKTTPKDKSNDYQFFVVKQDSTFLDSEYTYFGKVVSGMDVINRLSVSDKILSTDVLTK